MNIIIGLLLSIGFSMGVYADVRVSSKVDSLVNLVNDSYSGEFEKARKYTHLNPDQFTDLIVSVFSIEGFGGGNNWTQFIAVFKKSIKKDDVGKVISEPKYQLIGYAPISAKHKARINFASIQYVDKTLVFEAKDRFKGETTVKVRINHRSISVVD